MLPNKKPKLREGAYPCIFENLPSYLSEEPKISRPDPCEKYKASEQRVEEEFQEFMQEDEIGSFNEFKTKLEKTPEGLCVKVKDDSVVMFSVEEKGGPPKIPFYFKLVMNMSFVLWVNGVILNDTDNAWICPDGLLRRWSQLQNLWSHHRAAKAPSLSPTSSESIKLLTYFLAAQV